MAGWMFAFQTAEIRPDDELLAADREMMGQVLTFCAFVGGLALAGLITTIVEGEPRPNEPTWNSLLKTLQLLLATTSIVALFGAFMAMLGFVNHSRLLTRIVRLRAVNRTDAEFGHLLRDAVGKYANILVFKFMSRMFGAVSMASAVVVVFVATLMVSESWAVLIVSCSLFAILVPIVAALGLARRMKREVFEDWIAKSGRDARL